MSSYETLKKHWLYLFITPILFTALLTAHIKRYNLVFFSSEVLLSYTLLSALGLGFGLVMVFYKSLRPLILTITCILFLLSQIPLLPNLPYNLTYVIIFLFVVGLYLLFFYGLASNLELDKWFLIFFTVVWIGAFFIPEVPFIREEKIVPVYTQNKSLPPYIEIILDEHIGIDDIYPKSKQSLEIKNYYINHGFKVYEKAYSREKSTIMSFSSFLNFTRIEHTKDYLLQKKRDYNIIIKNKLFEELTKKGYFINIIQTNYLDFCKIKDTNLNSCLTYQFSDLDQTMHFDSLLGKTYSIMSSVFYTFHLSPTLLKLTNSAFVLNLHFPRNVLPAFPFPSSGYRIFLRVIEQAKHIHKGNAYFFHILLPHAPYVFDRNCNYSYAKVDESEAYSNQVQCVHRLMDRFLQTLANNPAAKDSILIIHGDHGSRIAPNCVNNKKRCEIEALTNKFSTLFMIRSPLYKPDHEPNQFSIDYLLKSIVLQKNISINHTRKNFVNIRTEDGIFEKKIAFSLS